MAKRFVTRQKNCYCHTCARDIHYLGINSHRAAHRRRFEDCKITFTYGDTYTFAFSERRPTPRAVDGGQAGENNGQVALPTATNA